MPETKSAKAPNLLNEDASASMATLFMSSHHGFRRDLALFAKALASPAATEPARAQALREEWEKFHASLHGHHTIEDTQMFPGLAGQHATLRPIIEQLGADHRRIDPLLASGDRVFGNLPGATGEAARVVGELAALLDAHLALEEAHVISFLRDARAFPPPPTEADAELYAQGFAWSLHGLAPEVVEGILAMLPPILTSKLPAARAAYAARCERAWGTAKTGASRTAIPDWL
jgi:hypothetical protein